MSKEHSVVVILGLGDETRILQLATYHWKLQGFEPIVHSVGWHDKELSFQPKLRKLVETIDRLADKGDVVSLVGISASGSAALNAFIERKEIIYRVVNVCGRLRTGPTTGFRSFKARTASSPSFSESVKLFESQESSLNDTDRQKIMTVRAMFGDELVPASTTILQGATNINIPTLEHIFSIGMALTVFSSPIIMFLKGESLSK